MSEIAERWDLDDRGELDDVVVNDVKMFRMERMSESYWWIGLYHEDGSVTHVDIRAKNGRSTVNATKRE